MDGEKPTFQADCNIRFLKTCYANSFSTFINFFVVWNVWDNVGGPICL